MNDPNLDRCDVDKVLFVWDGTERFIKAADELIGSFSGSSIHAMHAVPHESIHDCGALDMRINCPSRLERRLYRDFEKARRRDFEKATHQSTYLKKAKLEILFGDRIKEIVRFSRDTKVNVILLPQFKQSLFSRWIHGDLNERLIKTVKWCSWMRRFEAKPRLKMLPYERFNRQILDSCDQRSSAKAKLKVVLISDCTRSTLASTFS